MQSRTQEKNIPYNRKILPCHFANRQPRRDQSILRCNQNAIITRSIARHLCIASNFARRCSYPDRKHRLTARLNFVCGKIASQFAKCQGMQCSIFARPCSIDHAAMQKINGQKMKKTVQNQHFSPHRGKSSPHRGKSSDRGKSSGSDVGKAQS